MSLLPPSAIMFIKAEIEILRREKNEIVGEILEAQDKKMKMSGWKNQQAHCEARIARLEKLLNEGSAS